METQKAEHLEKLEELQKSAHVDRYGLGFVTQKGLKGETVASILDHHLDIESEPNHSKTLENIQ
ncbi:hypothetical protein OAT67_02745 [Bacteriovoracaceae bacterium]|nr:hypothetical protein [Bacteriovoracaceae bacterium]|tara:strand:+ start:27110 stop:27301 length:192 start_codon:yes stop_codon:yes gene_type:complete